MPIQYHEILGTLFIKLNSSLRASFNKEFASRIEHFLKDDLNQIINRNLNLRGLSTKVLGINEVQKEPYI